MIRFFAVALLAGVAGAVWAQPTPPSVRASADATVSVKPDQAKLDVGVVTEASTAQAAGAQNAALLQTALNQLRAAAGPGADIRTISYSLNPNYQYPNDGSKAVISGYTASDTLEVTVDDLASVGRVIDAATQGGANQIQRLQYSLKDPRAAQADALRQAARQARANVDAMAEALGIKLGKVLSVEQSAGQLIHPVMRATAHVAMAAQTPIEEPDTIQVNATVSLVMEIQP